MSTIPNVTASNTGAGALTHKILIGTGVGIAVGLLINGTDWSFGRDVLAEGILDTVGRIFLLALQMLVVPVVFVSLICGVSALSKPS